MQANEQPCDLPQLGLKGGMIAVWQYALGRFRKDLRKALTAFGDFYVTSRKAEQHLLKVQDLINSSGNPLAEGATAMHYIVLQSECVDLLLGLLSLGLDPDVTDKLGRTPSHYFSLSATGNLGGAVMLLDCRPNVTALTKNGYTPEAMLLLRADAAVASTHILKNAYMAVASCLEGASKNYPSLAQLAFERRCYAVKNLCRRRVFTIDDVCGIYNGRTAIQWAEAWQEFGLAEEMRYFFQLTPCVLVPFDALDNGLEVAVKQEVDVATAATDIGDENKEVVDVGSCGDDPSVVSPSVLLPADQEFEEVALDEDDESLLDTNAISENTVELVQQQDGDGAGPVTDELVGQSKKNDQAISEAVSKKFAEQTEMLIHAVMLAKERDKKVGEKLSNLENRLEEVRRERKNHEAMLTALKEENELLAQKIEAVGEQNQMTKNRIETMEVEIESLKRELESFEETWRKEKAAMTGQLKEVQDLLGLLPFINSSSVTAATSAAFSVGHPLPKKPKMDPES